MKSVPVDIPVYDVVIVGGGISGTALLYVLSAYTSVKKIALIEKYDEVAQVNSGSNNNSQTLHFGDIETNYTLEKAKKVKYAADMVRRYVDTYDKEGKAHAKYHKMVLAVGVEEVEALRKRYSEFKKLFPELAMIDKEGIANIEPNVVKGRDPHELILALFSKNGYTMDFAGLARSFLEKSKETKKEIAVELGNKVKSIKKIEIGEKTRYRLETQAGVMEAKFVVVTAGAYSLLFAKSLGYGKDFALLSVAGSFYLAPKSLNGKVYTTQIKKLPFAAIHGDPEVHDRTVTRYGPTAKALFMLERHKYGTVIDYFKTAGLRWKTFLALATILSDWVVFSYLFKNFLYDMPFIGKRLFIKEVRKIVPTVSLKDLHFAKGYGGIRPQIVNILERRLDLGEAKIYGDNIIFTITPSPGASTCLRNAQDDVQKIIAAFGGKHIFNKKKFEKDFG